AATTPAAARGLLVLGRIAWRCAHGTFGDGDLGDRLADQLLDAREVAVPEGAVSAPPSDTAEDEKPARSSRGRRGGREQDKLERAETAESTPAAEDAPRERRGRDDRGADRRERGGRGRGRGGRGREDDQPVIGLGDHVPAFLLRPVPEHMLKKVRGKKAEFDDDDTAPESEAA
ncbi:MAG: hypothetical protein AAFY66_16870, partial [Pseudomonadota bacterium]